MSTQVDYARIVLLNRTSRELAAANPVLLAGEAAVADVGTTVPNLRFGDGVRPWSALPAFLARGGGAGMLLTAPVVIPPGDDRTVTLQVQGAVGMTAQQIIGGYDAPVLDIQGGPQSMATTNYYVTIQPRPGSAVAPGTSRGLNVIAGTNATDTTLLVQGVPQGGQNREFFRIYGNGAGWLGPNYANRLWWDTDGNFGTTGTANLPGGAIARLSDVQLTNLTAGNTLQWSGTRWINAPAQGVVAITTGTGLTGGVITTHGTIALADTAVIPGDYVQASITVDQQGRITHAESGVILTNPQEGQAITFDGTHWVNSTPANALATLTDVALDAALPDDVLAFDGSHWGNTKQLHLTHLTIANDPVTERDAATKEYVDGAIAAIPPPPPPEEGITQLVQLTDVSVSGVQDGQVMSWDETAQRWRNRDAGGALATLSDVTVTTPAVGQLLTYNGTRWVNGGNAIISGAAGGSVLQLGQAGGGGASIRLLGSNAAQGRNWLIGNQYNVNGALEITASTTNGGTTFTSPAVSIQSSGAVTINAPSSAAQTLTLLGLLDNWTLVVNGNPLGLIHRGRAVFQSSDANNQYVAFENDGSGNIRGFAWNTSGGFSLTAPDGVWALNMTAQYGLLIDSTYSPIQCVSSYGGLFRLFNTGEGYLGPGSGSPPGPDQLRWDSLGHYRLGGSWISANNMVRTWIQGRDNEHGLYLQASNGTGLTFAAWSANNDAGRMQINNNGSVNIGVGNALTIDSTGQLVNILGGAIACSNSPRMALYSATNAHCFYITGAAHNATGQYLAVMTYGSAVPNDGCANGLYIQAGSPSFNDDALIVTGRTGTYGLRVKGNGNVCFPGIGPATASANAYIDGQRYLSIITSSGRYKRDIESLRRARAREVISKLRAVSFRSKCEREDPNLLHYGLIAEEVAAVDPVLVTRNADGEPQAVDYNCLSALLLTLLQDILDVQEPEGTWSN